MINEMINICSYFINYLLFIYLINSFFQKRITLKKQIILYFSLFIFAILLSTVFYHYLEVKALVSLLFPYLLSLKIYRVDSRQLLLCLGIYMISSFLSEMMSLFIMSSISQDILIDGVMHMDIYMKILLSVISNLLIFIFLKLFLHMTQKNIHFSRKYLKTFSLLLLMMSISSYLAIYCTLIQYDYKKDVIPYLPIEIIFSGITILWIMSILFFVLGIKRLSLQLKQELIINKTIAKNQEFIQKLLEEMNTDQYQYIRHDIMNYIQTYATLENKGAKDHDS